jgi:hypothetical protein
MLECRPLRLGSPCAQAEACSLSWCLLQINAGANAVIFVNFSDEPFAATGAGEHQGICLPVACVRRSDSGLLIRGQQVAMMFKVSPPTRVDFQNVVGCAAM